MPPFLLLYGFFYDFFSALKFPDFLTKHLDCNSLKSEILQEKFLFIARSFALMNGLMSKKVSRYLAYSLVVLFIFIAGIEIIGYMLARYYFPLGRLISGDPKLGYRLKPLAEVNLPAGKILSTYWDLWKDTGYSTGININSDGFRGRNRGVSEAAKIKVICFGDSMTFGTDVEDHETYSSLLEDMLRKEYPDAGVEVINAGVFGYSSRQGLVYAHELIKRERPQFATFGFGVNDYTPVIRRGWCALPGVSDNELVKGDIKTGFERMSMSPLQRIEAAAFGSSIFQVTQYGINMIRDPLRIARLMRLSAEDDMNRSNDRPDRNSAFERMRVPPRHHQSNLVEFIELVRAFGGQPVLIKEATVPEEYRRGADDVMKWAGGVDAVDIKMLFTGFSAEEAKSNPDYSGHLKFYEGLLGEQTIRENPELLLTTDGMHPNRLGHLLIAEALLEIIRNKPDK